MSCEFIRADIRTRCGARCSRSGAGWARNVATKRGVMKTLIIHPNVAPLLAQAAGGLAEGASKAMGIVMLFGFIFGTVAVIGGGFAIRRGDADAGKMSIIGGLIIAGAPVIVKALFTAFGLGGSTVDVGAFQ
jgi:hypothetical protein